MKINQLVFGIMFLFAMVGLKSLLNIGEQPVQAAPAEIQQVGAEYPLANGFGLLVTNTRHDTWSEASMEIIKDQTTFAYDAVKNGTFQVFDEGVKGQQHVFRVEISGTLRQTTVCRAFVPIEDAPLTTPVAFGCS